MNVAAGDSGRRSGDSGRVRRQGHTVASTGFGRAEALRCHRCKREDRMDHASIMGALPARRVHSLSSIYMHNPDNLILMFPFPPDCAAAVGSEQEDPSWFVCSELRLADDWVREVAAAAAAAAAAEKQRCFWNSMHFGGWKPLACARLAYPSCIPLQISCAPNMHGS